MTPDEIREANSQSILMAWRIGENLVPFVARVNQIVDQAEKLPRCEYDDEGGYQCWNDAPVCHLELSMYLCRKHYKQVIRYEPSLDA